MRNRVAKELLQAAARSSKSQVQLFNAQRVPWICQSCIHQARVRSTRISAEIFTKASRLYSTQIPPTGQQVSSRQESQIDDVVLSSTALPSHTEKQRWNASKRWAAMMDSFLARASVAGQHINVYTGTDYSGIENLRKEIIAREAEVRKQHTTVAGAKEVHDEARKKQAASQKEIVGLLERKASWSQADLERYMALVRSEHIDDQAVQKAAEEVAAFEHQLEATRQLLERLERQQYHEEQIWSDTIRRNSTWVTIGLMGINIVLLLAQISIFEPYRRRKIVDQIEQALDNRALPAIAQRAELVPAITVDQTPNFDLTSTTADAADVHEPPTLVAAEGDVALPGPSVPDQTIWSRIESAVRDSLSQQPVQMRQFDRTALVLESVAAGAGVALVCSLALLRSG